MGTVCIDSEWGLWESCVYWGLGVLWCGHTDAGYTWMLLFVAH